MLHGRSLSPRASYDGKNRADDRVYRISNSMPSVPVPVLPSLLSLSCVAVAFRLDVTTAVLKQSAYDKLREALTRSLWRERKAHRLSGGLQRPSQGPGSLQGYVTAYN